MLTDAYVPIGDDFVLQQDNAMIHTSQSTRQWLHDNDVKILEWPPHSPDTNPIESLWRFFKLEVNCLHPQTAAELWAVVQTTWKGGSRTTHANPS